VSEFYGILQGAGQHEVTKTGTKKTGITAIVKSWSNKMEVSLGRKQDGKDFFTVTLNGKIVWCSDVDDEGNLGNTETSV